jgi:DNA-binding transcriptional ArsR family regulator
MMTPQHVIKITKALVDSTRCRLLQIIANTRESYCGELARGFLITQATASQPLKVLTESGLVEARREGQLNYYRMRRDVFDEYQRTLATTLVVAPSQVA